MPVIRILIIAEDPLVRGGLGKTIGEDPSFQIVGSLAVNQFNADDVELFRPDILVWDTGWNSGNVQDALEEFQELTTPLLVLVSDLQSANTIWSPNLHGMVFRDVSSNRLFAALAAISQGISVFDTEISAQWFINRLADVPSLIEALTDRESEVLGLLAEGLPNKAIARQLGISDHTVKFHVNSIMGKLGAQSRTDAVVRATRLGIIHL